MVDDAPYVPRSLRRGQSRQRQLLSDRSARPAGVRHADRAGAAAVPRGRSPRSCRPAPNRCTRWRSIPTASRSSTTTTCTKQIRRIADDLTSYYLLGYYSTNSKLDGRFRNIKVRSKRPGIEVRARRGYSAPTPEERRPARTAADAVVPEAKAAVTRALGTIESDARAAGRKTTRAPGDPVVLHRGPSTGNQLQPADGRVFPRSERIRFEIEAAAGTPVWTGALLDRNGTKTVVPVVTGERTDAATGQRWLTADVTLAPLGPGDYVVELSIAKGSRDAEVARRHPRHPIAKPARCLMFQLTRIARRRRPRARAGAAHRRRRRQQPQQPPPRFRDRDESRARRRLRHQGRRAGPGPVGRRTSRSTRTTRPRRSTASSTSSCRPAGRRSRGPSPPPSPPPTRSPPIRGGACS